MFGRKPAPVPDDSPIQPTGDGGFARAQGSPHAHAARGRGGPQAADQDPEGPQGREEGGPRSRPRRALQVAIGHDGGRRALPAGSRQGRCEVPRTRDFVDARFTAAEFFIFIAIGVLVLGFIRNPLIQSWVSIGFFAFTALIIVDTVVLLIQLNMRAKKLFPDPADRKGITLYATLRTLQFRRLRLPPPRVKRGGAPQPPKGT